MARINEGVEDGLQIVLEKAPLANYSTHRLKELAFFFFRRNAPNHGKLPRK